MAEIVNMKKREFAEFLDEAIINSASPPQPKREAWVDSWELNLIIDRRQELMWKLPIMSDEITRLDIWLIQQPNLPLRVAADIWCRCMYCEWGYYMDVDQQLKHQMLLNLRRHYQEFQKLPKRTQDRLSPMWDRWMMHFVDEEMEAASGTA